MLKHFKKYGLIAIVLLALLGGYVAHAANPGGIYYVGPDGNPATDYSNFRYDTVNNQVVRGGTNITRSAAEANYLDISSLGTGAASKAVVLDTGDDYTWPAAGIFTYGVLKDPAGTTLGATAAELNQHADVSAMSELHSNNDTLTAADCGLTMFQGTDAKVFTLPATIAGCTITFVNVGADGNNNIRIDPNASDFIAGSVELSASVVVMPDTDAKYIDNTKGTSITGDAITIVGDGAGGWFITASTGIWAGE